MIRAIIVGPPGSGKGTISNMMVKTFGVKHIASGDLLRTRLTQVSQPSFLTTMKSGQLVSDDVVDKVVLPQLEKHQSWLLDGYPRTLLQAKSLMKQQKVNIMINLDVPDKTIIERLQGRWIHLSSGRIYHTLFNPPELEGIDDVTGEPLVQREDDHPDVIQNRLYIYHSQINPVLDYFKQLSLLRTYTGTESKVLWPQIKKDVEFVLD